MPDTERSFALLERMITGRLSRWEFHQAIDELTGGRVFDVGHPGGTVLRIKYLGRRVLDGKNCDFTRAQHEFNTSRDYAGVVFTDPSVFAGFCAFFCDIEACDAVLSIIATNPAHYAPDPKYAAR